MRIVTTDSGPTTKAELQDAFDTVLLQAYRNGIQVGGQGYTIRHDDPELPDWELEIVPIPKPTECD
jgi:hypothetical protein